MRAEAMQPKANDAARPSLLIADDDAVVRAALSAQLAAEFDVVAAVGSASRRSRRLTSTVPTPP
jgi:CheY-like chemotaxis protein